MLQIDAGARELPREESLALLATAPIGRLVFTDRALPAVLPVTFVLDRDAVVVRTRPGSALAAAVRGAVVAFEADDVDPVARNGWSVTVTGRARQVLDRLELDRLSRLDLVPHEGGQRSHYLVIPVELVTGRRVGPGPLPY